jgi:glycosyltransferase involved in cell wall biosynthesis
MISKNSLEIVAVIPALNESESIAKVIKGVLPFASVIVVDDGSYDSTAYIARLHGAEVVSHSSIRGYEQALNTGFKKALELGFKYVITLDADGQHDPKLIQKFHVKLTEGYVVVVGVRSHMQRFGEVVFSLFGRLLWGIRDPLCGMKAYAMSCFSDFDGNKQYDSIGTKWMISAVLEGNKFTEIDIKTLGRQNKSRFGNGLRVNIKIIHAMCKVIVAKRTRHDRIA